MERSILNFGQMVQLYDMIEKHDCNLDLILNLRSKPELFLNRDYQRGRPKEKNSINFEYLK